MKNLFLLLCLVYSLQSTAQTYTTSIDSFRQNYVNTHEVVKGSDRKYLSFFPIDERYQVAATFKKAENAPWFKMESSGAMKPLYRAYGILTFTLQGKQHRLTVYQSQSLLNIAAYKDYLFVPFTDATTGTHTYIGGRYIDLREADIMQDSFFLDFNKAYNPYCAYVAGVYSCPIPPAENRLSISIAAGEKSFAIKH